MVMPSDSFVSRERVTFSEHFSLSVSSLPVGEAPLTQLCRDIRSPVLAELIKITNQKTHMGSSLELVFPDEVNYCGARLRPCLTRIMSDGNSRDIKSEPVNGEYKVAIVRDKPLVLELFDEKDELVASAALSLKSSRSDTKMELEWKAPEENFTNEVVVSIAPVRSNPIRGERSQTSAFAKPASISPDDLRSGGALNFEFRTNEPSGRISVKDISPAEVIYQQLIERKLDLEKIFSDRLYGRELPKEIVTELDALNLRYRTHNDGTWGLITSHTSKHVPVIEYKSGNMSDLNFLVSSNLHLGKKSVPDGNLNDDRVPGIAIVLGICTDNLSTGNASALVVEVEAVNDRPIDLLHKEQGPKLSVNFHWRSIPNSEISRLGF